MLQMAQQLVSGILVRREWKANRFGNCLHDQFGRLDGRQRNEKDTIFEIIYHIRQCLQRQACFARAPRADECQQACASQ